MTTEMKWYIALCEDCQPRLPQPFTDRDERDDWASVHRSATGHTVSQFAKTQLEGNYDQMIRRTTGEPDPLVQEPKK